MVRDAGRRVIQVRQRRQKLVLAALVTVAAVIAVMRLLGSVPDEVTAVADRRAADAAQDQPRGPAAAPAPRIEVTWPVELARDLFAWESVLGPLKTGVAEDEPHADAQPPADVDTPELPRPDAEAIARQARATVRLEAILFESPPRALINGRLWREGEKIGPFRLQRIESEAVVVEKHGVATRIGIRPAMDTQEMWR